MSRSEQVDQRAAMYILQREKPEWSDADQAELDAWLEESMAHKAAYWRLEDGWRTADRLAALAEPAVVPIRRSWRPRLVPLSLLAAALIGAVMVILTGIPRPADRQTQIAAQSYSTPVGGRETVALADGSRVELNTATRFRASIAGGRREAWLDDGEAFFKIAHDPAHPFVIHAGDRQVTVLGTSFSVRVDRGRVTVSVVEGRVRLDAVGKPELAAASSTTLGRGELAIARGSETLISADAIERVDRGLAWRTGMLRFDQSTLAEVAAEFNRYNKRQMVVGDPAAASIRIGGSFRPTNTAQFLLLLQDAYGLRVVDDGEKVTISS